MKKNLFIFLFFCVSIFLFQASTAAADNPPEITNGPFIAAGTWPALPTDQNNPIILKQNYSVLYVYDDDFESCADDPTHKVQYKKEGGSWKNLDETIDTINQYVIVDLPIVNLTQNKLHKFRIIIEDCDGNETTSPLYYFIPVPMYDNPPEIGDGPFLAAGSWPVLPTSPYSPMVLDQNYSILWTFSDDFASCNDKCTNWITMEGDYPTWWDFDVWALYMDILTFNADTNSDSGYATIELPIDDLGHQRYEIYIYIQDCTGQKKKSGPYYIRVQ